MSLWLEKSRMFYALSRTSNWCLGSKPRRDWAAAPPKQDPEKPEKHEQDDCEFGQRKNAAVAHGLWEYAGTWPRKRRARCDEKPDTHAPQVLRDPMSIRQGLAQENDQIVDEGDARHTRQEKVVGGIKSTQSLL